MRQARRRLKSTHNIRNTPIHQRFVLIFISLNPKIPVNFFYVEVREPFFLTHSYALFFAGLTHSLFLNHVLFSSTPRRRFVGLPYAHTIRTSHTHKSWWVCFHFWHKERERDNPKYIFKRPWHIFAIFLMYKCVKHLIKKLSSLISEIFGDK